MVPVGRGHAGKGLPRTPPPEHQIAIVHTGTAGPGRPPVAPVDGDADREEGQPERQEERRGQIWSRRSAGVIHRTDASNGTRPPNGPGLVAVSPHGRPVSGEEPQHDEDRADGDTGPTVTARRTGWPVAAARTARHDRGHEDGNGRRGPRSGAVPPGAPRGSSSGGVMCPRPTWSAGRRRSAIGDARAGSGMLRGWPLSLGSSCGSSTSHAPCWDRGQRGWKRQPAAG